MMIDEVIARAQPEPDLFFSDRTFARSVTVIGSWHNYDNVARLSDCLSSVCL